MYSAPLSGLCPSRPGADFTLARSSIKASGGRGSVKEWRTYRPAHVLRPPPQLHLTLCCLSPYPLLRFTSIHSFPAKLTGSDSASLWEGSLPLFHRALQISVWAALSYLGVSGGGSLWGACRLPGRQRASRWAFFSTPMESHLHVWNFCGSVPPRVARSSSAQ